jgi:hypothetical protein
MRITASTVSRCIHRDNSKRCARDQNRATRVARALLCP